MFRLFRQTKQQYSIATMPKATGKTMDEWATLLNVGHRRKDTPAAIMNYLMQEHNLSSAWARTIASYYQLR